MHPQVLGQLDVISAPMYQLTRHLGKIPLVVDIAGGFSSCHAVGCRRTVGWGYSHSSTAVRCVAGEITPEQIEEGLFRQGSLEGGANMNIEALCAAPPEALTHSLSQMPLSCPVAPQAARS